MKKIIIGLLIFIILLGTGLFIFNRYKVDNSKLSKEQKSSLVINGIVVPPEPDQTLNSSTLEGVDTNKNGVRDDVERLIANNVTNNNDYIAFMKYALAWQHVVTDKIPLTHSEAVQQIKEALCALGKNIPIDYLSITSRSDVQILTFNTAERKQKEHVSKSLYEKGLTNSELSCGDFTSKYSSSLGNIDRSQPSTNLTTTSTTSTQQTNVVKQETEKINGIVVPPEPDQSLKDSTIYGVDTNRNGVRDDVERLLAGACNKTTYIAVLEIAKLYNRLSSEHLTDASVVSNIYDSILKIDMKRSSSEKVILPVQDIEAFTVNTLERKVVFKENEKLLINSDFQ